MYHKFSTKRNCLKIGREILEFLKRSVIMERPLEMLNALIAIAILSCLINFSEKVTTC